MHPIAVRCERGRAHHESLRKLGSEVHAQARAWNRRERKPERRDDSQTGFVLDVQTVLADRFRRLEVSNLEGVAAGIRWEEERLATLAELAHTPSTSITR
jgi:hypothetical protein